MSSDIELELEKIKNGIYTKFIDLSDNHKFKLPTIIEDMYNDNKITQKEKNKYEKELNEIVMNINIKFINIYNKNKEFKIIPEVCYFTRIFNYFYTQFHYIPLLFKEMYLRISKK
jgi:hypothetical protein